jgi:hypothetical protein
MLFLFKRLRLAFNLLLVTLHAGHGIRSRNGRLLREQDR